MSDFYMAIFIPISCVGQKLTYIQFVITLAFFK